MTGRKRVEPKVRFEKLTDKDGPLMPNMKTKCWQWSGSKTKAGYGLFKNGENKSVLAHRWVWQEVYGDIPDGKQMDHECNNTSCVRPTHLNPKTPKENSGRRKPYKNGMSRRTHCNRGHPYDKYARIRPGDGARVCTKCYTPGGQLRPEYRTI